jgi:CheY-like chemotaxis protein
MLTLIADDDIVWVKILSRFLKGLNYEVISAGTCAEALALAEKRVPGVILVDGTLMDGDAARLCAAIRARPGLDRTALVLISGEEHSPEACGADGFVLKGGQLAEIAAAIKEAAAKRRG